MNRVVRDLAVHPHLQFAVIWESDLLPIRFAKIDEALRHLYGLKSGVVELNPELDVGGTYVGRSLNDS